jgi:hypothetical protein
MCQRNSNQTCHLRTAQALALLVLILAPAHVSGQFQAMVKRVTAETKDGIRFTAWVVRQNLSAKQSITIYYEVKNWGDKTIYLAQKEGEPETSVDGETLNVPFVLPSSGDSDDYHYGFTKIRRGETHKGQLVLPAGKLNKEQTWLLNVSFGFVSHIEGLGRLRPGDDPAPFRGQLGERIKLVGLNGLVVDIKEP